MALRREMPSQLPRESGHTEDLMIQVIIDDQNPHG
jgi:hypothetical protein